jgi:hypothetical protein
VSALANQIGVTPQIIDQAVATVLDRAYSVAWFLRGQSARGNLGWIAISAEDDPPHRPVNVSASAFPQHDQWVQTPGALGPLLVQTRFIVATAVQPSAPPLVPPQRTCPSVLPDPVLPPNDQLILFIHGSDSRLEEAEALIPHLVRRPDGTPTGFSVISMDLPGSGYGQVADMGLNPVDHTAIGPWTPVPNPFLAGGYDIYATVQPVLLAFLEQFIIKFVSALSSRFGQPDMGGQPGIIEDRLAAVMGGSLGGNLSLRLGQLALPWLRNVVAYSPGSVWNIRNDVAMELGAEVGIPRVDEAKVETDPSIRAAYFANSFDQGMPFKTQPDQWYSSNWPCTPQFIHGARLDRQEAYSAVFRRWHWRISLEEMVWTWRDPAQIQRFRQRILLGAGGDDDFWPAKIWSNTGQLAKEMPGVAGDTFFFVNTGHSIHAERPAALAAKVLDFVSHAPITDLALTGGSGWTSIPVAFSNRDGSWTVTNQPAPDFAAWATSAGVNVLSGDFNGDGHTDIVLVGVPSWSTIPVAFSNRNGSWTVTNQAVADFAGWAAMSGVKVVTGDFNGDGRTDIALTGVSGWTTVPIAFSNGDGTWTVQNQPAADFAGWAAMPGVKVVTGDFNGDGRTDIALIGGSGWSSIPVAFSNGDGTWKVTNQPVVDFASWGALPNVKVLPGDFNGDGLTDIALTGVAGWSTIPVAYANGDGTWAVINQPAAEFAAWSTLPGVSVLTGDFNADGRADIALTGVAGWATIPLAFNAYPSGAWGVTNLPAPEFAVWAASPGVKVLTGDFNRDGRTDIALTGVAGWSTIPVASSNGDGSWTVRNQAAVDFAGWASQPNVSAHVAKIM